MRITVELPDDLAGRIIPAGVQPERLALEDIAVEAYRAGRLTEHQLAMLLGMDRYALDGFLKERGAFLDFDAAELRREIEAGEQLWRSRERERSA